MIPMKQILLICAVVALVGCGGEEKATSEVHQKLITNPIIEKAIREKLEKPEGELTKADYEKVTKLYLGDNQLTDVTGLEKLTQLKDLSLVGTQVTDVKGLEKLTKLERLELQDNQLTSVKGLENLTQLRFLGLKNNPGLTKAQIDELQKALPKCQIEHTAKK